MTNVEAVRYAKECRVSGLSKVQVREALLDAGWDYSLMEKAVDEAFGPDPNDLPKPENPDLSIEPLLVASLPVALAKNPAWRQETIRLAADPELAAKMEMTRRLVALVLGVLAMLGSFAWFKFSDWVLAQTLPAQGVVVDFRSVTVTSIDAEGDVEQDEEPRPVVRFTTPDGKQHEVAVKTGRFYMTGDAIEIAYDPAAPDSFAVIPGEFRWNIPQILLGAAGLGSGLYGTAGFFDGRRRKRAAAS